MGVHEPLTGAQRAARRRAKLRAQGLRPVQFWLPSLSDPAVQERIRKEVAAHNAQMERWSDIVDDGEAFAADILKDFPPPKWVGGPDEE